MLRSIQMIIVAMASVLGCREDDGPPAPACEAVCPGQKTCELGGWYCAATEMECQDLKPCPGAVPDCEVVCPTPPVCTDGAWYCDRFECASEADC
jgi:hypothetical protein